MNRKDVEIKGEVPLPLLKEHKKYLLAAARQKESFEHRMSEHLRMSGMYWCLTALDMTDNLSDYLSSKVDIETEKEKIINFIIACHKDDGGFSASVGHDSHLLYTLSAIQVLILLDSLNVIDTIKVAKFIANLQQNDGSFVGDQYKEVDTRFSFCAIACLSLMSLLYPSVTVPTAYVNVENAVNFVLKCKNFDGGFGTLPGSESHSGQIYCCVGLLAITKQLHRIDQDQLGWWLCERQLPSGGLNGRPEKLPDVCYSWWVLSSLTIIDRIHWLDKEKLVRYICACQDSETGGITDRPGDYVDPFHTLFGLAGIQLLGLAKELKPINPIYCMPQYIIDAIPGI